MKEYRLLGVGLAVFVFAGCGSGGRLSTVEVTGTVTVDGKPIQGAIVEFHPEAKENSRPANSSTDENGYFALTTYDSEDGAVPGSYIVTIGKIEFKEGVSADSFKLVNDPNDKEGMANYTKMMTAINQGRSPHKKGGVIPAKYGDKTTSDLKRTVEESGGNEFNFKLKTGG